MSCAESLFMNKGKMNGDLMQDRPIAGDIDAHGLFMNNDPSRGDLMQDRQIAG